MAPAPDQDREEGLQLLQPQVVLVKRRKLHVLLHAQGPDKAVVLADTHSSSVLAGTGRVVRLRYPGITAGRFK